MARDMNDKSTLEIAGVASAINRSFLEKLIRRLVMTQTRQAAALQDTTDQLDAARKILDGMSK